MESTSDILDQAREVLRSSGVVAIAHVFGSTIRKPGTSAEARDLDLAVVFRPGVEDPLRMVLDLNRDIERATGRPTDLHEFERLPLPLRFRVLREGRVLFEEDPVARRHLEARTMLEYFDFEPLLSRIRRRMRARIARGRR